MVDRLEEIGKEKGILKKASAMSKYTIMFTFTILFPLSTLLTPQGKCKRRGSSMLNRSKIDILQTN